MEDSEKSIHVDIELQLAQVLLKPELRPFYSVIAFKCFHSAYVFMLVSIINTI